MNNQPKNIVVAVKVTTQERDALRRTAEADGRTVNGYIRHHLIRPLISNLPPWLGSATPKTPKTPKGEVVGLE